MIGCNGEETVTVPNFIGMDYGDAVRAAYDLGITLVPSSEYNDDVLPNSVISQGTEAGTEVATKTSVTILYSRGYSPDGVIDLIDFSGMTQEEVQDWVYEQGIRSFYMKDTFDDSIPLGQFSYVEVVQTEDRDDYQRQDSYYFYFSRGQLEVEDVTFNPNAIKGVNLGGWFVLEGWMTSNLFLGVSGSDETVFMQEKEDAASVIENHWDTFITEDDFIWLKEHDIDTVRLPIPWWLFGETYYQGTEHEVTYASSVYYIDRAMTWAEDHDIDVLLDLHTAPGCQNGFDNGGVTGLVEWDSPENVALTLDKIDEIMAHFSQYDSLWGFEVLNEPASWAINVNVLKDFYVDAYDVVRSYEPSIYVGFHDAFTGGWGTFFADKEMTNIFLDIHLYQVFGDQWGEMSIQEHIDYVHTNQKAVISQYKTYDLPVIVGEWSMALPGSVYDNVGSTASTDIKQAFLNAQLNEYEQAMGWFFWNYKIENGNSYNEWNYRKMVEDGYFPEQYN
jgi:glucan 1,3-beta-glucosidase